MIKKISKTDIYYLSKNPLAFFLHKFFCDTRISTSVCLRGVRKYFVVETRLKIGIESWCSHISKCQKDLQNTNHFLLEMCEEQWSWRTMVEESEYQKKKFLHFFFFWMDMSPCLQQKTSKRKKSFFKFFPFTVHVQKSVGGNNLATYHITLLHIRTRVWIKLGR